MESDPTSAMPATAVPTSTYSIGDRVMIHGLEKSPHINGLHGTIVTEPKINANDGVIRYGVDFDLVSPSLERSAIKVRNLRLEPPSSSNIERAQVQDGALVQSEGMVISFVLDMARFLAARYIHHWEDIQNVGDLHRFRGTDQGLQRQNMCMSSAWTFWNEEYGTQMRKGGIYSELKKYLQDTMANDDKFNGDFDKITDVLGFDYKRLYDAVDDVRAVKGWNVRITGEFWIVDMDNDGTYLVSDLNRNAVYQCVGVRDAIWPKLQGKILCMRVTMIPWYGRLIYDGVLTQSQDRSPSEMVATPNLSKILKESVNLAKNEHRVITRLSQLEVEGGSLKGIHDMIPRQARSTTNTSNAETPATSKEIQIVNQLKKLPVDPEPSDRNTMPSNWVFRRFGYQKKDNPNNIVVILSSGMPLNMFSTKNLRPKAHEILEQLLDEGKKKGKLPFFVLIDDKECLDRAKFLCSDFDALHLDYYVPPTEEETSAAYSLGPFT